MTQSFNIPSLAFGLLLTSSCPLLPGCAPTTPAEGTTGDVGGETGEVLLLMYGNPPVVDGYPDLDAGMTRVDLPSLDNVLEVFDQLSWADAGYSPHMALSATHPDALNLERPADQHDSDIILAEWHAEPESRYATLESVPQARQVVEAWYNGQDLTDLADWKTAEELDQQTTN